MAEHPEPVKAAVAGAVTNAIGGAMIIMFKIKAITERMPHVPHAGILVCLVLTMLLGSVEASKYKWLNNLVFIAMPDALTRKVRNISPDAEFCTYYGATAIALASGLAVYGFLAGPMMVTVVAGLVLSAFAVWASTVAAAAASFTDEAGDPASDKTDAMDRRLFLHGAVTTALLVALFAAVAC